MKTPTYRWVCHKCQAGNEPGTQTCLSCGFPANASGRDIAALSPKPEVRGSREPTTVVSRNTFLFFPEIIIAGVVVLGTPVWVVRLLLHGAVFPALALIAGVFASAALFVLGFRSNSKRGLDTLLTRVFAQMSRTWRSSAKPTRQLVPSPVSMVAVRWLMRTMVPTWVCR